MLADPIVLSHWLELEKSSAAERPTWVAGLLDALEGAPDPQRARLLASGVIDAAPRDLLLLRAEAEPARLARVLHALCGIAPFFAPYLVRHPEWLLRLLDDDLATPRTPAVLARELDALVARDSAADPTIVLRHFKYFELARISVRDACEEWVPLERSGITLSEISQLADILLARAMEVAREKIAAQLDPPRFFGSDGKAHELRFSALGLGKLGASELNYSSDVDLVYLHETPPPAAGALEGSEPAVYFARLAQEFGRIVSSNTSEGFLYRVDLDLRPEGTQGNLVVPSLALHDYYECWADTWEKAAFMKARPVAGDIDLGWEAIRDIAPMIYSTSMNFRGVDAIRSLKEKIASARGGDDEAFNVKIDPGGIRDVEFVAQLMQLLHGGRIPQIRNRSTLRSLQNLVEVDLLDREVADALVHHYLFLRRIENRLQMEAERQVHKLPRNEEGMKRLARAMGYREADGVEKLRDGIAECRRFLQRLVLDSFGEGTQERVHDLFSRGLSSLIAFESGRRMLDDLANHFSAEIDACPDSERALNNLDRFIHGAGERRFYFELLLDRPELVKRLSALFAASNYLSSYLARYPRLIEPLFENPSSLLLSGKELEADYEAVLEQTRTQLGDSLESQLDALRLFHHRQVVNVGLLDLAERCEREEVDTALSEIAEVCIDVGLGIGRQQLAERAAGVPEAARDGEFVVVGMGKLATRELSYGSDLDVIFLYCTAGESPTAGIEAQDFFIRLAQRFISSLQTPTAQGSCYEVDARLRPSGNQGMLVSSLEAFERYHKQSAQVWERQALLRSRPVAGNHELARTFEDLRRQILLAPLPEDLAEEIHRVRLRMEEELARETSVRRDFKIGRGGVLDVESAVQYLQLRHGPQHLELLDVDRLESHLERLGQLSLIDEASATGLLEGWRFLLRLGSRLRVVENRSISEFDLERGDLDTLALQLGYPATGREGGASRALLRDYDKHTEEVRRIYLELLQA
jgi:glutamate-ammonia-ligase adenylyltransferase